LDKSDYYAAENFTLSDYHRFDYRAMVVTNLLWPNFYCLQDIDRLREDLVIIAVGDVIQPDYFNRFTQTRFPMLVVPPGELTKGTGLSFLKNLIFLNSHHRSVYLGPDQDIILRLSYRVLPEVLFFRLVTEKETQNVPKGYYAAYVKRLDAYVSQEIESQGPDFFADEVFVDYYRIVFTTLSSYMIDRKLWDEELEVLQYSASLNSLTIDQMIDTGVALMNRGENTDAEIALRRCIAAEPANRRAHIYLGHVLLAEGRLDEAQKEFDTVLRLHGEEFAAYFGMGLVAYERGDFSHARDLLKKAGQHITGKTSEGDKKRLGSLLVDIEGKISP
jgi:tetratricopeptide (TPR) repeat protein